MSVLGVADLVVAYGAAVVVDRVDFTVDAGEIVALIGPNGAGKSSLLDAVAGVVPARSGQVLLDAHTVTRWSPARRHAFGLGRTHQTPALLGPTPRAEVALAVGRIRGVLAGALRPPSRADRRRADELLDVVALPVEGRDSPSAELGLPDQRRVELARSLAHDPRVLLLDEPASGLPTAARPGFVELLNGLRGPERAVLLVEHDMDLVSRVADRVVALDRGAVVASGSFAEVTADPRVRESYLGAPA